jgi:hypothetical protein
LAQTSHFPAVSPSGSTRTTSSAAIHRDGQDADRHVRRARGHSANLADVGRRRLSPRRRTGFEIDRRAGRNTAHEPSVGIRRRASDLTRADQAPRPTFPFSGAPEASTTTPEIGSARFRTIVSAVAPGRSQVNW